MSEQGAGLPPKNVVAESILEEGSLFVHFDPRSSGVVAPAHFKSQAQLVFQFGYGLAVSIPDLLVDEEGISGTLSFQRTPHACFVPWSAVFALVGDDGRGMVFPESMPVELRAEVAREASRRAGISEGELREEPEATDEDDEAGERAPDNVIHVAFGKPPSPEGPKPPPPPKSPPKLTRIK